MRISAIPTLLVACLATACAGTPLTTNEDGTVAGFDEVKVGVGVWFPEVDSSITVQGANTSADNDLDDAFDTSEMALTGRVEFWEGDAGFIIDATHIDVDTDTSVLAGSVDSHIRDETIDFLVAQRFALNESTAEKPASSAVISGGMRYRRLDQRVSAKPGGSASDSHNWIEPVIGAGVIMPTSEDFAFTLRGDMSGFDIGSGSHRTWNAFAGGEVELDVSNSISFGWRMYDIDLSRGSGAGKFGLDGSFSGPVVGWNFAF
jgi:hypothetical protein